MDDGRRTRIAPTPSGFLHEGNAFNFVLTWALARRDGREILLRIDDADQGMVREDFVDDIFRSLDWLGITWDMGPQSPDELAQLWSQRHRFDLYHTAIHALMDKGLVFACSCTRTDVRRTSGSMTYTGTCAHNMLDLSTRGTSLRLNTPETAVPYPVVRQKSGAPAYMIASMVDDIHFGITHIVRGEDLHPASQTQQHLATLVDMLAPFQTIEIVHHPLIVDEHGMKLSKSQGSTDLRTLREQGVGPERVIAAVGRYLGVEETRRLDDLLT
jgi:glutamyl-tRNA synthetase